MGYTRGIKSSSLFLPVIFGPAHAGLFFWSDGMANWGSKSRHERKYGKEWEALRKIVIARDKGLCQPCAREGRVTRFQAVDHIMSRARAKQLGWSEARTESPENCQAICEKCHSVKTEEEQGKTKRPPKPTIGPDGWPIEK